MFHILNRFCIIRSANIHAVMAQGSGQVFLVILFSHVMGGCRISLSLPLGPHPLTEQRQILQLHGCLGCTNGNVPLPVLCCCGLVQTESSEACVESRGEPRFLMSSWFLCYSKNTEDKPMVKHCLFNCWLIIKIEYTSCWTNANRKGYVDHLNNNYLFWLNINFLWKWTIYVTSLKYPGVLL